MLQRPVWITWQWNQFKLARRASWSFWLAQAWLCTPSCSAFVQGAENALPNAQRSPSLAEVTGESVFLESMIRIVWFAWDIIVLVSRVDEMWFAIERKLLLLTSCVPFARKAISPKAFSCFLVKYACWVIWMKRTLDFVHRMPSQGNWSERNNMETKVFLHNARTIDFSSALKGIFGTDIQRHDKFGYFFACSRSCCVIEWRSSVRQKKIPYSLFSLKIKVWLTFHDTKMKLSISLRVSGLIVRKTREEFTTTWN